MADGSSKVVYAALAEPSRRGIEVHRRLRVRLERHAHRGDPPTSDCTNQLLLLIGARRGKLPRRSAHPFGYGMEIYFWTFVVAVLVLLAGGAYSIYRGFAELADPHPIGSPELSLLGAVSLRHFRRRFIQASDTGNIRGLVPAHRAPGETIGLIQFIKLSKDPSLYESLLEDGAALAGIAVAAAGIVGSAYFGLLRADGAASVLIGGILVANGIAILVATRSLVAGEAVAPPVLRDLWSSVRGQPWSDRLIGSCDIASWTDLRAGRRDPAAGPRG